MLYHIIWYCAWSDRDNLSFQDIFQQLSKGQKCLFLIHLLICLYLHHFEGVVGPLHALLAGSASQRVAHRSNLYRSEWINMKIKGSNGTSFSWIMWGSGRTQCAYRGSQGTFDCHHRGKTVRVYSTLCWYLKINRMLYSWYLVVVSCWLDDLAFSDEAVR